MKLSTSQKFIARLSIGSLLLIAALGLSQTQKALSLALYIAAYLILGYDVLINALQKLFQGKFLGEDFLMSIATVGAFSIQEYPEAVAVMLFYQLGELIQHRAEYNSRKSIEEVMDIRPDSVCVIRNGENVRLHPSEVSVGEHILIAPGERIALDSEVLSGSSHVDTSALTGEALPLRVEAGDELISGTVNQSGLLVALVKKGLEESTVSKILKLVEESSSNKASQERFITRFAKVYTPIVVALAALIATLPPLFIAQDFSEWLYRALAFLVVSCPCALVISVPLAFFGGIGGAARHGVLVKGGTYLEMLAEAESFIFDKTGTLTEGTFSISETHLYDGSLDEQELLRLVAHAESFSNHPIAQSLVASYQGSIDANAVSDLVEHSGRGITAKLFDKSLGVGSPRLVSELISDEEKLLLEQESGVSSVSTTVYVVLDGKLAAKYQLSDKIRNEATESLLSLSNVGVKRMTILSGDHQSAVVRVASTLGIAEARGNLLPHDKLNEAKGIIEEAHRNNTRVAIVGDGINDAPMLAIADVGISMGALGSDAAIEASDVVIMANSLAPISRAIEIAKKTKTVAAQNIVFALGVKVAVLALATFGQPNLVLAILADVGVAVLAIVNASRTLYYRSDEARPGLLKQVFEKREALEGETLTTCASDSGGT